MPRYRSDQGKIHLSVDGVGLDSQSWDSFEGGDITPDSPGPYSPGGMAPSRAQGGLRKRSNATIQRAWTESLMGIFGALDAAAAAAPFTCSYTPMKNRTTPAGPTITYTGVLLDVTRPGYNSTSSAIVMLQCVLECDEDINITSNALAVIGAAL